MPDEQVTQPHRCCGNCCHWFHKLLERWYCELIVDGDDRTAGNEFCEQWGHDDRQRFDTDGNVV